MSGKLDGKRLRIVLYEGEGSEPLDDQVRLDTLVALLEEGHPVTRPAANRLAGAGAVSAADASDHRVRS